jgi:hypothetical protein
MKRIMVLVAIIALAGVVSCGSSGVTGHVVVNFYGVSDLGAMSAYIDGPRFAGGGSASLPVEVNTITLQVTTSVGGAADMPVLFETFTVDEISASSGQVSFDIPAGNGLLFSAYAYNIQGELIYQSAPLDPIDIGPGDVASVALQMGTVNLPGPDALINITLLDKNGSSLTAPSYASELDYQVEVYSQVAVVNDAVTFGGQVGSATVFTNGSSTSLASIPVRSSILQIIFVKAVIAGESYTETGITGSRNPVALFGGTVSVGLAPAETRTISVQLQSPLTVDLTLIGTTGNIYAVINGTDYLVGNSPATGVVNLDVPSGRAWFGDLSFATRALKVGSTTNMALPITNPRWGNVNITSSY